MKDKEKRNKIIFGLFIIFLMVSSTAGFIYSGNNTKKINGFKFIEVGNGWQVWIKDIESYLIFRYLPTEIEEKFEFLNEKTNIKIYNENWSELYVDRLRTVLIFDNLQTEIVDELFCDEYTLVLDHSYSDLEISTEEKCFYLNGDSTKFIDGITYKIFGVI